MYNYNDNELLYLIEEKNDYAFEIMFKKYIPLIKTRIRDFKIKKDYEDFLQEGILVLNTAIRKYRPCYNKTFNKYFDFILQRKYIQILRREKKNFYNIEYLEDVNFLKEENREYLGSNDYKLGFLSILEKQIFYLFFVKRIKPSKIALEMKIDVRKVYNAIARMKKKIKNKENILT